MARKDTTAKDFTWTDEEVAEFYETMYQTSMQHGAAVPAFPSYLKGHQRHEEYRREEASRRMGQEEIKAEIRRLQGLLDEKGQGHGRD